MDRVRRRVGDKRVLAVVKAFLHAGILGEDGIMRNTTTGTPQGGILSPLLANIALSVLDEHFAEAWQANSGSTYQRTKRRRAGLANCSPAAATLSTSPPYDHPAATTGGEISAPGPCVSCPIRSCACLRY